jgi:hypothetical protein
MDPEDYKVYREEVRKTSDKLKDNEEALDLVTKASAKTENAMKALSKEYSENLEVLEDSEKGSKEYVEACGKIAKGLNTIFGEDSFDTEFVEKNLDKVKAALAGDLEAM